MRGGPTTNLHHYGYAWTGGRPLQVSVVCQVDTCGGLPLLVLSRQGVVVALETTQFTCGHWLGVCQLCIAHQGRGEHWPHLRTCLSHSSLLAPFTPVSASAIPTHCQIQAYLLLLCHSLLLLEVSHYTLLQLLLLGLREGGREEGRGERGGRREGSVKRVRINPLHPARCIHSRQFPLVSDS